MLLSYTTEQMGDRTWKLMQAMDIHTEKWQKKVICQVFGCKNENLLNVDCFYFLKYVL